MTNLESEAVETSSDIQKRNQSDNSSDEESNDSSLPTSITPKKRRRLTDNDDASSPESFASPATNPPPVSLPDVSPSTVTSQWQLFAQKESNLEALLQHSFEKISELVVNTCSRTNDHSPQEGRQPGSPRFQGEAVNENMGEASREQEGYSSWSTSLIREVVEKEKATSARLQQDNLTLESKYKDSKDEIQKLHQVIARQKDEVEESRQEVRQAHQEAKNYQAQAKESRNQQETLAMQLQNLQVVVQETKKSSELLIDQQDEITQMARTMEEHYIQSQATSIHQKRQHSQLQQEHQILQQDKQTLQQQVQSLQKELKAKDQEIQEHWKQSVKTLQQKQVWNTQRIESLEEELQESKTLTLQALTTTAQSQATSQQLQTELATLQSTLDQNQREAQTSQNQARLELQNSTKKVHAQQQTNHKLVSQLKQVQHQCQDFGLELSAMEQLLQEQQRDNKRDAGAGTVISPSATAATTGKNNPEKEILCAHKCCALPNLGWTPTTTTSSSGTAVHSKSIITPTTTTTTATNHGGGGATIRIVPPTRPSLYVCLHCVQAVAQPILRMASSSNNNSSKKRSRKRRKVVADTKKAPPEGADGTEAQAAYCSSDLKESKDARSSETDSNSLLKVVENLAAAEAHDGLDNDDTTTPSPKTRLTSAVARMVGPSHHHNKTSNTSSTHADNGGGGGGGK